MPRFKELLKSSLPDGLLLQAEVLDHCLGGEPGISLVGRLCSKDRDAIEFGANIELANIAHTFSGPTTSHKVRKITIDGENIDNVGFTNVDVEQGRSSPQPAHS